MKPIRVAINAMTLPSNLAGIGFYTINLAAHLAEHDRIGGIEVFSNRHALEHFPRMPGKVKLIPLDLDSIVAKVAGYQFLMPRRLQGLDVLHSVGNVACLATSLPQVVTIHDLAQRHFPDRFGWVKRNYLNWGLALTSFRRVVVVCDSACTREDLARFHPSLAREARVIHLACKFPIDRSESWIREGFLFVGTLEPGKNLEMALRVLAMLRDRHGIRKGLSVVGARGWKQSHLADTVRELDLGSQVDFLGYLDDEQLRMRYRTAECLIFPSIYEGFGFPVLEAQSQGCPVVVSDNSSLREIGGEGCHYFPTNDREGLLALLRESQARPESFASIRGEGFRNCERFSWSNTARNTLEAYEEALARRRPA